MLDRARLRHLMAFDLVNLLFRPRPVEFPSDATKARAMSRLQSVTKTRSVGAPWSGEPGLVGFVSDEYVYLTRQKSLASGGFRVQFVGKFAETAGGSVLAGRFVEPAAASLIFIAGLAGSAAWGLSALWRWLTAGGGFEGPLYAGAVFAAVLAVRAVSRRLARYDETWMSARIGSALGADSPADIPS